MSKTIDAQEIRAAVKSVGGKNPTPSAITSAPVSSDEWSELAGKRRRMLSLSEALRDEEVMARAATEAVTVKFCGRLVKEKAGAWRIEEDGDSMAPVTVMVRDEEGMPIGDRWYLLDLDRRVLEIGGMGRRNLLLSTEKHVYISEDAIRCIMAGEPVAFHLNREWDRTANATKADATTIYLNCGFRSYSDKDRSRVAYC